MSEVTCPAREWRCDLARQIAVPAYRSTAKASDRVGVAHPPEDGTDGRREGGLGRRPPEATRRIRLSDEASPAIRRSVTGVRAPFVWSHPRPAWHLDPQHLRCDRMRRRSDTLQGSMWRPDQTLEQSDVTRDLPPVERRKLEEFIRWADDTAESLSPASQGR